MSMQRLPILQNRFKDIRFSPNEMIGIVWFLLTPTLSLDYTDLI
jgi:hypothetical protein